MKETLKALFGNRKMTFDEFLSELPENVDIINKTEWVQRTLLDRADVDRRLDTVLATERVRNITAARALLDLEALYAKPDSLPDAVARMRQQNPYLFDDAPTQSTGLRFTQTEPVADDLLSDEDFYKKKFGQTE